MRTATVNIIGDLISAMAPSSEITTIAETATGSGLWNITVCNPLWVRPLRTITIGGTNYTVTSVDYDTKIIQVSSVAAPAGYTYSIDKPFYFHGTPLMVKDVLNNINIGSDKLPMIYLYEVLEEEIDYNDLNSVDRTSDLTLCFLDQANFADWDVDQHYDLAIMPMIQLSDFFIDTLNNSGMIGDLTTGRMTYHSKFNINTEKNGVTKGLFADEISGCVLKIRVPFMKELDCDC